MNHLAPVPEGENRWHLPTHAHVVVYERDDGGGLLTIYDCGAAQKPPSAQLLGTLDRVEVDAEIDRTPTGRIVKMREESALERRADDRYRIVRA